MRTCFYTNFKIHVFKCWFSHRIKNCVIAGDGKGFDFTFLLTFSSLFLCAGQLLQELNIAKHTLASHLPALESRDPASTEKSCKCDFCHNSAVTLWH